MLDLLLIPAALLLTLALRAVRQGEYRLHGYLMTGSFTLIGLRVLLHPRDLTALHLTLWLATLGAAGMTMFAGRMALAWREGRSTHHSAPRIHRATGTTTLIGMTLTTLVWLLRNRS